MDKPDRPHSPGANPGDDSSAVADQSAVPEASTAVDLAEGRTERIAVMRHELAHLQRQLIDAQQRIAAELQGRAEDADRLEELEARVQAQELKAREDAGRIGQLSDEKADMRARLESANRTVEELGREIEARDVRLDESRKKQRELTDELETHVASLRDTKAQLEAQDSVLATRLAERDTERATTARLEQELDASRGKHQELAELLETQASSLREAKALLAEREAELATRTSERDAQEQTTRRLKGDLEEVQRALDGNRARAQELARQITTLGQELDAVATGDGAGAEPPRSAAVRPPASTPPPIPGPRPAQPPKGLDRAPVEAQAMGGTSLTSSSPSRARGWLLLLGGIAVGVAVSAAVVKLGGSKKSAAPQTPDVAEAPPTSSPMATPVADDRPTAPAPAASAAPAVATATDASASGTAPSADTQRTGVIVLPATADGHRIFVDGRLLQPINGRVEVPCGKHEVQIGSRDQPRMLEVACDGETQLP